MTLHLITGLVLIALPIAFNLLFFMLARSFEYPDILRKPTAYIMERFSAGGARLVMLWYAFAITALFAIPLALLLWAVFNDYAPQLAFASAIIGVLSGLTQTLGLLRWSLLVPGLAAQYNGSTSASERESIRVVFNAFHQYMGVIVGEHLGYLFTGAWSILISLLMLNTPVFSAWLGILGIVSAIGILAGMLEPAGWKPAGSINAMSYILWSVWLVIAGVMLILT